MDPLDPLYSELLEFAGHEDDGRRRQGMLTLARKLSRLPEEKVAAFLWLHDVDKGRLHLDFHCPNRVPLFNVSLEIPADKRDDQKYIGERIGSEPRVLQWLKDHGLGRVPTLFSITEGLGYLVYFSEHTVAGNRLLHGFCSIVASRIKRHRTKRELDLNNALVQIPWEETTDLNSWLKSAARVVREHTRAYLVVVFRLNKDLGLESVASNAEQPVWRNFVATASSLVRGIYIKSGQCRILSHQDIPERVREFGTEKCDDSLVKSVESFLGMPLRSWIGAAICHQGDPVAVMFVANKMRVDYYPSVFSRTDFTLVQSACKLISKAVPHLQTNRAIRDISTVAFKGSSQQLAPRTSTDIHADAAKRLDGVFEVLSQYIPGLAGAAIGLRLQETEPATDRDSTIHCDRVDLREILDARLKQAVSTNTSEVLRVPGTELWCADLRLPYLSQGVATLHVLLRRTPLASHENEIMDHACAVLGQFIRDQQAIRDQERELIEFRHAVRSGLQGLGHLDNACETYELITRQGRPPEKLRMAMFRKALEFARLYSTRTRHLVEQSRYLIDHIDSKQLRRTECDIGRIVREAVRCLKPDADKRRIVIDFNNQWPPASRALVDKFLIEIIVFNLLDNAIKYSFRERTVSVTLKQVPRNWELTIGDFGDYIRPGDREIIFQPRIRRPSSQTYVSRPGTGIGLAVLKQVIDAHHGRVSVESIPENERHPQDGAHTTFTLTVPVK